MKMKLCSSGKKIFGGEKTAQNFVDNVNRKGRKWIGRKDKKVIRVYQCTECSFWHTTSKGKA